MRSTIAAIILGVAVCPAFAEDNKPISWVAALESAEDCIEQSKPDFERAIACYEHAIASCVVSVPTDEYKLCLERSVEELTGLLPLYNSHTHAEAIALQYDPDRCEKFDNPVDNLPEEELLMQCKFIALLTQITAGHVASIWGELRLQD